MDAQEHEYELGTLEDNILDRDESQARQGGSRGDERRWMILGGAGTLALLTAIVAAVSLGGTGEPRTLSATLRGPSRDLSALSAHLQSSVPAPAPAEADAPDLTPKARIARAQPAAKQPVVAAPVAAPPEATQPAAVPTSAPVSHAAVADTTATSFANLPTVSAVEESAEGDEADAADVVPTNFEQDDDPFAEDPSESEDDPAVPASEGDKATDDEAELDPVAEEDAPAEAPAPTAAPPPAPAESATPPDDVAVAAPTPA